MKAEKFYEYWDDQPNTEERTLGKAILANGEFSEARAQAVSVQDDLSRESEDAPNLSDIVATAILMASFSTDAAGFAMTMEGSPVIDRMQFAGAQGEVSMRGGRNCEYASGAEGLMLPAGAVYRTAQIESAR